MKKTKNYRRLFSALIVSSLLISSILIVSSAYAQKQNNYFTPQVEIPGSIEGDVQITSEKNGQIYSVLLGRYIAGIYNYSFAVAGILAAIVLMAGGLLWLVSGGNQNKVGRAKQVIGGAILGLVILFTSYIILKTINPELLEMKALKIDRIDAVPDDANRLGCCQCTLGEKTLTDMALQLNPNYTNTCQASLGMTQLTCEEICKAADKDLERFFSTVKHVTTFKWDSSCSQPAGTGLQSLCVPITTDSSKNYPLIFDDSQWTFDTGIKEQIPDMSPELAQVLNCMADKLPTGVGRISSISDSNHIGDLTTCEENCKKSDNCVHTCGSCHYGGTIGSNKSYAVDFADEENYGDIYLAAKTCDAGSYVKKEKNSNNQGYHIHFSIYKCPKN